MSDIPNLSYDDLLQLIARQYNTDVDNVVDILNKYNVPPGDMEETFKLLENTPYEIWYNSDGSVRSTVYNATGSTANTASDIASSINSNTTTTKTSFNIPISSNVEKTSETASKINFKAGLSKTGKFVIGEVTPAICAASVGITCGKLFDKWLYNLSPDFWNEHDMSTLNPDTWSSITSGDTSAGATLFNFIYGINANNNTTQAYMDENALAYMALYLQTKGVLDHIDDAYTTVDSTNLTIPDDVKLPMTFYSSNNVSITDTYGTDNVNFKGNVSTVTFPANDLDYGRKYAFYTAASEEANNFKYCEEATINNKTFYFNYGQMGTGVSNQNLINVNPPFSQNENVKTSKINLTIASNIAYLLLYGYSKIITGIGTQDDAITPDLSEANTPEEALNKLKEQYPDLWDNAISQDVVQPDGSTKTYTYVPVAMPDIDEYGNPISSASTQANPQVQPETATKTLLDLITKIIQRDPPINPPDTGDGDTPPVVPPSGSASSLYAIYNPTLSQINAFGAWLWSDNFVDQIKKLFNDPMQAIIGLHKVYATPATGGAQTIKVGYLDSGVSSKVVSNQYTTIDCGSVSLSEYFGNVFDYEPYTKVNLYLPFIGIVPLSVGEVMRSAIHVVYHVDVLTGACLAEVKIKRDSAGGTLFQYSGNAAVQYPISSGSYMGIISGIMSIAGGVAGTIATGGAAMPVLLGAGASIGRMHTDISHSGNFSGNAGAMGIKKPYLIIDRPQTALAKNFSNYVGYPSNSTVTLSGCKGFTKVKEIHLENIPATNNELTDIETKLKGGVII